MNWRRHLTKREAQELRRFDKELAYFMERMALLRGMRKRIQNRAYARGRK